MGRNNAQTLNSIRMLCRMQQVEEKVLYERSKLILSIYRDVCWSTVGRADEVHEELIYYCGSDLDSALVYLETFTPDEARERFEERIRSLFETKWIIELVEDTMLRAEEICTVRFCRDVILPGSNTGNLNCWKCWAWRGAPFMTVRKKQSCCLDYPSGEEVSPS